MLTCYEVNEKASCSVELSLLERFAVRIHMMICVKCRRYQRQLKALIASLARIAHSDKSRPAKEFVKQTLDAIEKGKEGKSF